MGWGIPTPLNGEGMKITDLVRDAKKVYGHIRETDAGELVALKPVKVLIPARFPEYDLAIFEEEINILGICAFVVEDKYYAVSLVPAMMRTEPTLINNIRISDVDYIELSYDPGSRIIANLNLVKVDSLLYRIYDEMIAKGRVPWYLGYEDLGRLFENSHYHAGERVGSSPAIFEMIVAAICRSSDDAKKYYRQTVAGREDLTRKPPTIIPLRAVSYGATNTIAKIMGSHFNENVTSALVSPGERVEKVEQLLRM